MATAGRSGDIGIAAVRTWRKEQPHKWHEPPNDKATNEQQEVEMAAAGSGGGERGWRHLEDQIPFILAPHTTRRPIRISGIGGTENQIYV